MLTIWTPIGATKEVHGTCRHLIAVERDVFFPILSTDGLSLMTSLYRRCGAHDPAENKPSS